MDNAPRFEASDQFDQRRVRLADIDGSGTTDIIYLGADTVRVYFNRSGNSWSAGLALPQFPRIDDLTHVSIVDLLGNGTSCLVWSSQAPVDAPRPLRYWTNFTRARRRHRAAAPPGIRAASGLNTGGSHD